MSGVMLISCNAFTAPVDFFQASQPSKCHFDKALAIGCSGCVLRGFFALTGGPWLQGLAFVAFGKDINLIYYVGLNSNRLQNLIASLW